MSSVAVTLFSCACSDCAINCDENLSRD